ncbi:hypothetical protein F5Y03DRAFT_10577 [Xylaria venustula]|nr:hypothetical protein F5Y03DRAFT_10577 [Xylaria venustula]
MVYGNVLGRYKLPWALCRAASTALWSVLAGESDLGCSCTLYCTGMYSIVASQWRPRYLISTAALRSVHRQRPPTYLYLEIIMINLSSAWFPSLFPPLFKTFFRTSVCKQSIDSASPTDLLHQWHFPNFIALRAVISSLVVCAPLVRFLLHRKTTRSARRLLDASYLANLTEPSLNYFEDAGAHSRCAS